MTERARLSAQIAPFHRSQSCRTNRDKVTRTASELHRQTVNRAQRRFEQQLENSERELELAVGQRRDLSASPVEKLKAKQNLENLRTTLNNDYVQLIQAYVNEHKEKVNEVEKYMNQRHDEQRQLEQSIAQRKLQEAIQEAQLQSEKVRLESINQVIRERDAMCEEKLATQKNLFNRLLEEQARRFRAEQAMQSNTSSNSNENFDLGQLKGRLARIEYEHRELKQLVLDLRSDLSSLLAHQPFYRSTVHIPNFVTKP